MTKTHSCQERNYTDEHNPVLPEQVVRPSQPSKYSKEYDGEGHDGTEPAP
jgi:hypothetical protein